MMKKSLIICCILVVSNYVLAALPGASDPTEISIPSFPQTYILGGSLFYLEPAYNNDDLIFAKESITQTGGTTSQTRTLSIEPGYAWSWNIYEGYLFPGTGNDIRFSYFNFHTNDTASLTAPIAPGFEVIINPFNVQQDRTFNSTSAETSYALEQADATVGQYINVGCRTLVHAFTGIRWMDLDRNLNTTFATFITNILLTIDEKSQFEGLGPVVGIDDSYYLGLGFGLVAHGDAALLIGDSKPQISVSLNPSNQTYNTDVNFQDRIVPMWDAKLGANYTFLFHPESFSSLTLEIGYQVSHYYNAITRLSAGPGAGGLSGISINQQRTSDFGLYGPYASLTLHI